MSGKIGFILLAVLSTACVVSVTARAFPARNGMFYYPRAQPMYYRPNTHSMYIHYGQNPYRANLAALDESGVSAFASGNKIAAETFYKESQFDAPQYVPAKSDEENVVSVAEAYPEVEGASEDEIEVEQPAELAPPAADVPLKVNAPEEPFVNVKADADANKRPAQNYPVDVPNRKKKVYVKIDEKPVEEEADEDSDDEDEEVVHYVPAKKRKSTSTAAAARNPGMTSYFPINFGSTAGGAIAIANSFSTGKGGTATSHATAYGSPNAQTKRRMAAVAPSAQED